MVRGLVKPGDEIVRNLTPGKAHLWHMASGIAGEICELLIAEENRDKANVLEESGDSLFYIEGALQLVGLSIHGIPVEVAPPDLRGVVQNTGDVIDAVKRFVVYGKDFELQRFSEAANRLVQYIDSALNYFGLTREDALAHNFAKLGKRYAGHKYSDAAANARADKLDEPITPAIPEAAEEAPAPAAEPTT